MSAVETILSGVLPIEIREALRTLLSLKDQPYLDIPAQADGPGICVGTSYAALRRFIETENQMKSEAQPKVPANYTLGRRHKLPDGPSRRYRCVATQTDTIETTTIHARPSVVTDIATQIPGWLDTPLSTAHVESAPEARRHKRKRRLRQVICLSSSDTDPTPSRFLPRRFDPSPRCAPSRG
jgi:hypothetical protein